METGRLDVTFHAGEVRELARDGEELVQRVFPTVRDAQWATASPRVERETTRRHDDGTLSYAALLTYEVGGVAISGQVRALVSDDDGAPALDYFLRLTPHGRIEYRRIGLCVLHPLTQVGAHVSWSGATSEANEGPGEIVLPELVAPQEQVDGRAARFIGPFRHLAISTPGHALEFAFDGDDFEMEDQRNWSDASFKTYSTPLALGGPHTVDAGDVIEQRVTLRASATTAPPASGAPAAAAVRAARPVLAVVADAAETPDGEALALARTLGVGCVVVDGDPDALTEWADAARGAGLDLQVRTAAAGPATDGLQRVPSLEVPELVDLQLQDLEVRTTAAGPATDGVQRVPSLEVPELVDLQLQDLGGASHVWFTLSPFVHANDEWSLSRAPESLPAAIATARALARGADLWLGPLRWDADEATRRFPPPPGSERRHHPGVTARDAWFTRIMAVAGTSGLAGVAPVRLGDIAWVARRPALVAALGGWN